jgi:Flp pilus assembly protein TadD
VIESVLFIYKLFTHVKTVASRAVQAATASTQEHARREVASSQRFANANHAILYFCGYLRRSEISVSECRDRIMSLGTILACAIATLASPSALGGNHEVSSRSSNIDERVIHTFESSAITMPSLSSPQLVAALRAGDQSPRDLVTEAAMLLDSGDWMQLEQARANLQRALALDPNQAGAYVELARYTMKASGTLDASTLTKSEDLIRRGLAIAPSFGNGYVLLGYVLTHERKLQEAEQAFADARKYNADSPWLQNNEAELHDALGQQELAEKLFAEIAASPSTLLNAKVAALEWLQKRYTYSHRYDQAAFAYTREIQLKPTAPFPKGNYSQFLRMYRLDLDQSELYAREALTLMDYGMARRSLALTLYLKWADALAARQNARADQLFAEAAALGVALPEVVKELGYYVRPHSIVYALATKGISVDTLPGTTGATTPLSMAAGNGNQALVAQLVQVGANPNTQGYAGFTPLMMAAQAGNESMVQLLLALGADPKLLSAEGKDAEQFARGKGHPSVATMIAAAKQRSKSSLADVSSTVPLKIRYIYRVKKTISVNDWNRDFRQGEEVAFYGASEYGESKLIRFGFVTLDGNFKEFSIEKENVRLWNQYFEEVGSVPSQLSSQ